MSDLRNKLVRLAYQKPELREKLIPVIMQYETLSKTAAKKVKPTKVTFIEAVLENPNDLTSWLAKQDDAPSITGWDVKSHHMTLEFLGGKGSAKDLERYKRFLGETYTIDIIGLAYDESCVAVLIDTNLPVKNKYPHITIAVNGVKPAYSNELIEAKDKAGEIQKVKGKLRVKVGYFDGRGGGDKFELPHEFFESEG